IRRLRPLRSIRAFGASPPPSLSLPTSYAAAPRGHMPKEGDWPCRRRSGVEAQAVDHLVDRLSPRAERDPDEVEVLGRDRGDGGAIRLVVAGRKELRRVDRRGDPALHRPLVGPAE